MPRRRTVLVAVVAVAVLPVGGATWYLRPIAPIATGYAAKTVCSGHFVSGRPADAVLDDLPDNPLVPYLRTAADDTVGTVSATLLGFWRSTAWYTPGLGCTLAAERPSLAAPAPVEPPDPSRPWPAGDGPAVAPADVDVDALAAAVDAAFTEDDARGRRRNTRAVAVVRDGQLVAERYADGFGPHTPLIGWSMTKSVTNAIVGRLVAAGDLAVSDADLRPQWSDDERSRITIEQLLSMTSGLAFEEVYDPDTDATRMLYRPVDAGEYAASKPLLHAPGTTWSYSSGTTNILCDVAQDASGLGTALARDLVFAPLGMASAVLEPDVSGGLVCSSNLYATARDWARFGQWFLQDGAWEGEPLLPEDWVETSTTHIGADPAAGYGWHWWLNQRADGTLRMASVPADAYWASGNEGQHVVVVPSADVVVVRLGFSGAFEGIEWGLERLIAGVLEALEPDAAR